MPAKNPQERIEQSRIGAYARRDDPDSRAKEAAARARLAVLQTRRRLVEAAEAVASAERELAALGVEVVER